MKIMFLSYFIIVFIIIYFFFPHPAQVQSMDNIPTYLLPISLLNEHNFDFNEFTSINSGDRLYFAKNKQMRIVSQYPVFNGVIITPFYYLYSLVRHTSFAGVKDVTEEVLYLNYFIAALFVTVTSYVLYRLIYKVIQNQFVALLGSALFIFATPVISIASVNVWSHTISLLFISLLIEAYVNDASLPYVLLLTICSVLSRPTTACIAIPLIAYSAMNTVKKIHRPGQNRIVQDGLCVILSISLICFQIWYSWAYLNGYMLFAYQYRFDRFSLLSLPQGFLGLLISPSHGLLVYSPFFIISFIEMWKQRYNTKYLCISLSIVAYFVVNGMWDTWYGSWSIAYRMLLEIVPALILFFSIGISHIKIKKYLYAPCIIGLIIWSIAVNSIIGRNYGNCNYDYYPDIIDFSSHKTERLWLDSPIIRCIVNQSGAYKK